MIRLCSSSTIRQQLLKQHNIPFIKGENDFDEEQLSSSYAPSFVYQATCGKHQRALAKYGLELPLLVVDSAISCQNQLQRKAKNMQQAREFLHAQSGSSLVIFTCMILHSQNFFLIDLSQTSYKFSPFCQNDLENYLQSHQWQNKAGGVMIEGFHKNYIRKQQGFCSNAMGLNIPHLKAFLQFSQKDG